MKILIVDDNAMMRREIKTLIADLADEFCECADGAAASAAIAEHGPDFVLMDIAMEHMDGIAATREIIAAHPSARIIIVTGYDDKKLRAAAQAAGACGYVLKENLFEVRRLLQAAPE
jgi:DNA-binding NarL/FixJ family response regulator